MPWTELETDRGDGVSGTALFGVPAANEACVLNPADSPSTPPLPATTCPFPRPPYLPPPLEISVRAGVTKPPSLGQVEDAVEVDPRVLMEELDPLRLNSDGFSTSEASHREESSSSE